jgi:cytoskeletal protein CcmA (bactofilin family)
MSEKSGIPVGKHTLVEEGTEFKGNMSSNVPIVVMGKIEGELAGPMIFVTATGVVAGKVKVKELHSNGELAGEFEADIVQIAGRVRDQTVVRARTLEVSLANKGMEVIFGECELAIGDEPNKEAAIAAALAAPAPTAPAPQVAAPAPAPTVTGTAVGLAVEKPVEGGKKGAQARRRGASEAWDDPGAQLAAVTEATPADEEHTRRKRATTPPD